VGLSARPTPSVDSVRLAMWSTQASATSPLMYFGQRKGNRVVVEALTIELNVIRSSRRRISQRSPPRLRARRVLRESHLECGPGRQCQQSAGGARTNAAPR
jgi:hypothetical protein